MPSRRIVSLILPVYIDLILNTAGSEVQNFPFETCQTETINQVHHEEFYPLTSYTKPGGLMEIKVRFRGVADGGIALSQNENMSLPHYLLAFGSYNNQRSEVRKSSGGTSFERTIPFNTPGIMSQYQFRGFIIRYNSKAGTISASSEGNEMPLMFWKDPNPLNVTHYSFSTWTNRIVLVAFNCKNRTSKGNFSERNFWEIMLLDRRLEFTLKVLCITASIFARTWSSKITIFEDEDIDFDSRQEVRSTVKRMKFNQDTCQLDRVNGSAFGPFYAIEPFRKNTGLIELVVRFKGPSDGHVMLSINANASAPFYVIILGSLNNTQSEIRKSFKSPVYKLYTKGIMSVDMFRGFLIRYNENAGELWVLSEGSEMPLLHWKDTEPIPVNFFSFSSFYQKEIQVAFNCRSWDKHELLLPTKTTVTLLSSLGTTSLAKH
ncbi:unnamed protein product [Allacma fusca]|uniref:Farnesoic acid O-methyl transferase domain-containing protein n=1 Tax=Allacma fusca TaxID=39272 RepID=A0A8J2L8W9_9HEXA|nr:unnamed protein product [Allacma fusca]